MYHTAATNILKVSYEIFTFFTQLLPFFKSSAFVCSDQILDRLCYWRLESNGKF